MQALAQAARFLRRQAGFTAFAVATLGLGIGASTSVFTLVRAVLLRELPVADPDSLVWMYNVRTERDRAPLSIADLEDYRAASSTVADFAMFTNWTANLTGIGPAERLEGTRITGNFFDVLGARPLFGRLLRAADEESDSRVAVVTFGLWKRRFGADRSVLGRSVLLNGAAYIVVGILPEGFMFPFREAEVAVPLPLRSDPRRADRGANFLRVVARLRPGVPIERAKADLDGIARRLQQQYPEDDSRKIGVSLYPLHSEIVRDYRLILWTVFGAVALFVIVGAGNLANLLLARSAERASEFAVRTWLGASRRRIIGQLASEASLIAVAGALVGMGLATMAVSAWRVFAPANFPRREEVAVDAWALAFAIGVAVVVTVIAAIIPALSATQYGVRVAGAMRAQTAGPRALRTRRGFVALQTAGAVLLLTCMGLVVRSFIELSRVPVGFTADHALSLQLSLPPLDYSDRDRIEAFAEALRIRFAALPGVRQTGAVSLRPLSGLLNTIDIAIPGRPTPPPDEVPQAHFRIATAGYFGAAGIKVVEGRAFEDRDAATARPVAIVSQTFATRHWPGASAVGQYVQLMQNGPSPPMEVVGVVTDVKQFGVDAAPTPDLYVPLPQMPRSQAALLASRMYWVLRTDGDPRVLAEPVRAAVQSVDANVATSSVQPLDETVAAAMSGWRMNVRLLELFGQLAVLLCALGVYAVASYAAAARRRELAIRAAFGAVARQLVSQVIREELTPIVIGLACGLIAAVAAARQLGPMLFRTSPSDPLVYVVAGAALFVVAVIATYVPARRAAGCNPVELLRQ